MRISDWSSDVFSSDLDGTALYDRLGDWFTLLVFGDEYDAAGWFEQASMQRGVPLKVLMIDQPELLAIYEAPLILVRPDQHIAWRGKTIASVSMAVQILHRALGSDGGASGREKGV